MTTLTKLSKLKAKYFVYMAIGAFAFTSLVLNDYNTLKAVEQGYADYSAMNRVILPFHNSNEASITFELVRAAFVALVGFAILIAIAKHQSNKLIA